MDLKGELEAARNYQPMTGSRCTVCQMLLTLPADEAVDLRDILADGNVMGSAIAKALNNCGHPVKPITVQRHRNGGCRGLA